MNKRVKQYAAAFVCLCVTVVSILSFAYIAKEIDHDCTGEHCTVCEHIQIAEQVLKSLSSGAALSAIVMCAFMVLSNMIFTIRNTFLRATPVSQKIRMNN